jgi:hypothetical protein
MEASVFKKIIFLILLGSLLVLAACTSTQPWKGKPRSQMTPAELEEQDPMFWTMYGHLHGLGE